MVCKLYLKETRLKVIFRAALVAQQFGAACSLGCDPGDDIKSHVGLPVGGLLLPLPVSLLLSLSLSCISKYNL